MNNNQNHTPPDSEPDQTPEQTGEPTELEHETYEKIGGGILSIEELGSGVSFGDDPLCRHIREMGGHCSGGGGPC